MTELGRIMLLYRCRRCRTEAQRMLDALDDRYRARNVVDVGIEDDVAELKVLAGRLAPEDVVLALVGAESDYWSVPLGDDGTITIRTARVWRRPSAVRPRCA